LGNANKGMTEQGVRGLFDCSEAIAATIDCRHVLYFDPHHSNE
jgi:hypothetical protein